MKSVDGYDKLRGGYYTPDKIASFISAWAIRNKNDTVLEPSCGDGSFLCAASETLRGLDCPDTTIMKNVTGVELDPSEADKSQRYGTTVINGDFFTYYRDYIDGKKAYDVVIGNPPFIRYQNFDESFRQTAFALMNTRGFNPNRLTNIWIPFLCLASMALTPDGRLGMVIPAELFQVNYASEARQFLSTYFDSLTIITFRHLVFENIQQEIVLLLGERHSDAKGIRVIELDGLDDLHASNIPLSKKAEIKSLDPGTDKWTKYFLTNYELKLLEKLNRDARISNASDLYDVNVGLVSGENAFFIINKDSVLKNNLQDCVEPIISRSEQLKGVCLTYKDYDQLAAAGKKVFMFNAYNVPYENLSESQQDYITWGEQQHFHQNYKCRIRERWFYVPQSWYADAFLIRQANQYPRMILNEKHALVTDTLHKVRFHEGVCGKDVVAAFLNSYTLALSETIGRSYGGGVLTFEPGEMRAMQIPMANADKLDFQLIDSLQRDGKIEDILDYTDGILLHDGLGLDKRDIDTLRNIWIKMRDRRLGRKTL